MDDEEASIQADKLARTAALHARWEYKDTAEEPLHGDALIARERHRCREFGPIVFRFSLHDEQVDAIRTLFFEQRDLLLLAKTGFGKSLIFQLLPFMTPVPGLVLILMPLKLLQAEQSTMINRIANAKSIVLNGENNLASVHREIAKGGYTHIFYEP